jgi:ribosome-associated toxin RatA of RatAB toxin-antitoxin module
MRTVTVTAVAPATDPDTAYRQVADFARYPEVCETVLAVRVESLGSDRARSTWEVEFRDGVMEWTEEDRFDADARTIDFEQVDGDFEHFTGRWTVLPDGSGSTVHFAAQIDLGMPSLGNLLEPIAERSLGENVEVILRSLLGDQVRVAEQPTGS